MKKKITTLMLALIFSVPPIICQGDSETPSSPATSNVGSGPEQTGQQKKQDENKLRADKKKKSEDKKNTGKKEKEVISDVEKPGNITGAIDPNVGQSQSERKL
jgi:hypothetical protein